jgi:hypothetical protein
MINEKHEQLMQHLDAHAQERVPFNVQSVRRSLTRTCFTVLTRSAQYLDEFSRSLANEVRVLLQEVGDLREKKRAAQLCVSVYSPSFKPPSI